MNEINESEINIVSEKSVIIGRSCFDQVTRIHGTLKGEVESAAGSTLIVSETGAVEGNIRADTLIIDGFVQGDISATKRLRISNTGRVIGNIECPTVQIEFGAFFDGECKMEVKEKKA